jgi:hypothetical protein
VGDEKAWTLGLLALWLAWPGAATAQEPPELWDTDRGVIALERADWSWSFEPDEVGEAAFTTYEAAARPSAREWPGQQVSGGGLDGDHAGVVGGDVRRAALRFDEAASARFAGRRVVARFWTRAEGTTTQAEVRWISGDPAGQLLRGDPSFFAHRMGTAAFLPTGRATADGWVEVSAGPFDFDLGGRIPAGWIEWRDVNAEREVSTQVARDPGARALIDALTIQDVGPARVPDAACDAATEEAACGEAGVCLYGRCADAVSVLGSAPQSAAVRQAYLARRAFELETFTGVRAEPDQRAASAQALAEADTTDARAFWRALRRAYDVLVDGHAAPPSARATAEVSPGACAYLGELDLTAGGAQGLLVYEVFDEDPESVAARIEPGDEVARIAGLAPLEFMALVGHRAGFGGDPRGEAHALAPELLRWAAETGSSVTLRRCAGPGPCAPEDADEVELDLAALLGAPIWDGLPPGWRFDVRRCDFRVARIDDAPEERNYGFADSVELPGGVRVALFNGFPAPDTGDGASGWLVALRALLSDGPDRVIFDQRWGTGGSPAALTELHAMLLRAGDPDLIGETIPPVEDGPLTLAEREALRACSGSCGMYGLFRDTPEVDGPAAEARVAILSSYDVSANDFFAARMRERPGRTRLFGPAPTFGAFGYACSVPGHLPGERAVGYQCTDTIFFVEGRDDGAAAPFVSGIGVEHDEAILQKQSDTLAGVDTVREAAIAWLEGE